MIFPDKIPVVPDTEEALLGILISEVNRTSTFSEIKWHESMGTTCGIYALYEPSVPMVLEVYNGDYIYYKGMKFLKLKPLSIPNIGTITGILCIHGELFAQVQVTSNLIPITVDGFNQASDISLEEIFKKLVVYESQLKQLQ